MSEKSVYYLCVFFLALAAFWMVMASIQFRKFARLWREQHPEYESDPLLPSFREFISKNLSENCKYYRRKTIIFNIIGILSVVMIFIVVGIYRSRIN